MKIKCQNKNIIPKSPFGLTAFRSKNFFGSQYTTTYFQSQLCKGFANLFHIGEELQVKPENFITLSAS